MSPASLLPGLALLAGLSARPPETSELCLFGGEVLDPAARTVAQADLVLKEGVIAAVAPPGGATCHGKRIDVAGQIIMPGLIDLHVHGWGNPTPTDDDDEDLGHEAVLALVLRAGVMATLDLAGDDRERLAVRDRLRGSPDHAAFYVASALMARRRSGTAADEDEQRRRVRAKAGLHPDFIKIIDAGGSIAALVDEARRLGFKTIVHISSWDDARAAVRAGATAITHLEDEVELPADLAAAWAEARPRIWSIPTMAVQCDVANLVAKPALLDDPLLARVTGPKLRATYRDPTRFTSQARYWERWQREGCVANDFKSLRALHQLGITLLAGSDTGNLGTFQGFSVHREMELMVAAGVPAWDALRAATSEAARFLDIPWGVKPGAPANLIVLAGSPLVDIRNTRKLRQVIYRGRLIGSPPVAR